MDKNAEPVSNSDSNSDSDSDSDAISTTRGSKDMSTPGFRGEKQSSSPPPVLGKVTPPKRRPHKQSRRELPQNVVTPSASPAPRPPRTSPTQSPAQQAPRAPRTRPPRHSNSSADVDHFEEINCIFADVTTTNQTVVTSSYSSGRNSCAKKYTTVNAMRLNSWQAFHARTAQSQQRVSNYILIRSNFTFTSTWSRMRVRSGNMSYETSLSS